MVPTGLAQKLTEFLVCFPRAEYPVFHGCAARRTADADLRALPWRELVNDVCSVAAAQANLEVSDQQLFTRDHVLETLSRLGLATLDGLARQLVS